MFDINNELETILKKHGLWKQEFLSERIAAGIRSVLAEATEKYGRRIILRGLKESPDGYPLVKLLSEYGEVVAVVDKNPFTDVLQIDEQTSVRMCDTDEGQDLECDVYVINSKFQGKTIYYEMKKQNVRYYLVDLYTEIRIKYSILLTKSYNEYRNERDFSSNKVHDAYELFQKNRCEETLKSLLSACLMNRDFVTYYDMIEEAGDLCADSLSSLKSDIDGLILEVRKCLADRRTRSKQDIIMHWIDQVTFDELNFFPKLKKRMEDGCLFEQAYTVIPYTIATEACIFQNQVLGELNKSNVEEAFKAEKIENSDIYQKITKQGYLFYMTGAVQEDCMPEQKSEYTQFMVTSSVNYWNMLNLIINSDQPVFGVVGCLAETHEPWMAPKCGIQNPSFDFSGSYKLAVEKIKIAASYFDDTIDFFSDILGPNTINIYMSDHGKWEDVDLRRYSDYAIHTILGVNNIGMKGTVSRIFSYKYFPKLIESVLFFGDKKKGEHIFGDMELRSPGFIAAIKEKIDETFSSEEERQRVYSEICSGYVGVKTEKDTYIRLNNNDEIYFLNSDGINRIHQPEYSDRIDLLRRKLE